MEKYEAGDHPTMGALAHKLKPSIDNMGIITLKETIREIEKAGKGNSGSEKLPGHLHQLDSVMAQVVNSLKQEFKL
jgi:hypothetical protein